MASLGLPASQPHGQALPSCIDKTWISKVAWRVHVLKPVIRVYWDITRFGLPPGSSLRWHRLMGAVRPTSGWRCDGAWWIGGSIMQTENLVERDRYLLRAVHVESEDAGSRVLPRTHRICVGTLLCCGIRIHPRHQQALVLPHRTRMQTAERSVDGRGTWVLPAYPARLRPEGRWRIRRPSGRRRFRCAAWSQARCRSCPKWVRSNYRCSARRGKTGPAPPRYGEC